MAIKPATELNQGKRKIDLRGPDGNAFVLLGIAKGLCKQLENNWLHDKNWEEIQKEMTSGDYEHLISVFDKYFGEYVDLYR